MALLEKYLICKKQKQLTISNKKAVLHPFYSNGLINGIFSLKEFLDITPEQSKILIHPAVINLIKLKIITLNDAKKISAAAVDVIRNESYQALIIKKGKDCFDLLQDINEEESITLLIPEIINLIFQGLLSIESAKRLPDLAIQKLTGKNINHLLLSGKLTVEDALLIDKEVVDHIESSENIYWLIAKGIIAPHDSANILTYDAHQYSLAYSSPLVKTKTAS